MESGAAKLRRAREHREALGTAVDKFREIKPHRWNYVPDYVLGDQSLATISVVARVLAPTPREWGLIIGDILTNLRAALDHALFAHANSQSRLNSWQAQSLTFPILVEESKWAAVQKRLCDAQVASRVIDAIHSRQPFGTSDPDSAPLTLLNRLVNIDKHRTLQVVTCVSEKIKVTSAGGLEIVRTLVEPGVIRDGMVGARLTVRLPDPRAGLDSLDGQYVETAHETAESIVLPRTRETRPVLEVIDGCIDAVEEALAAMGEAASSR